VPWCNGWNLFANQSHPPFPVLGWSTICSWVCSQTPGMK